MSPGHPPTLLSTAPEVLQQAADLLEARQNGTDEPEGSWVDRVWLPSEQERRACCAGLEPDRLKDPQKLRNHCRTLLHVANYFDVDGHALRAEMKRRRQVGGRPAARATVRPGRRLPPMAAALAGVRDEDEVEGAAELAARVTRLIDDKRSALARLAQRAAQMCEELQRQLASEEVAVESALTATGATEIAAELQGAIEELNLLVTVRTLC